MQMHLFYFIDNFVYMLHYLAMIKFEAGFKDILKLTAFFGVLWLLSQVLDILALVFIAIIITSAINPVVDFMEAKKIPRQLSILSLVIVFGLALYIGISSVLPSIIMETADFVDRFTLALNDVVQSVDLQNFIGAEDIRSLENNFYDWVGQSSGDIISIGVDIFGGLLSLITLLVVTFYLLVDHGLIKDFFLNFAGDKEQEKISKLWDVVERKLGVWLRGQLFVMLIIGIVTYIGLRFINMPLALPLAIIAGVFEIVPIIGPIISAIPAMIIAFSIPDSNALIMVLTVAVLYFIIQQLEAVFVVPKVMNTAVGLNPIVIILAVTIGSQLGGPVGALLSVPIAVILYIALQEWRRTQSRNI